MNPVFLRAAAITLLLAVLPTVAFAQEFTPPPATTPAPTPKASAEGIVATGAAGNVAHVRQLIRDVQSNTDNIKSKGDFGCQLWLVEGQQFFQDWVKPATPSIDPVTVVQRGEPIYSVIIFYGLAHDNGDLANVSYDITVHRPDGSVYSQSKTLIGWQGLAPQDAHSLELGRDHISINIEANDPAGLYTVEAVVRDNVSRVELPLKQTFVVQ